MNKRLVFSIIAGLGVYVALGHLLSGPAHCVDGSLSGSIGHRGACSHHGGVADPSFLPLVLAIAVGFLAYRYGWGALTAVWASRAAKTPPLAGDRGKSFEKPPTWRPEKIENIRGLPPTRTVDIGAAFAKGTLVVVAIVIALAASAAVHEAMVLTNTDISSAPVKTVGPRAARADDCPSITSDVDPCGAAQVIASEKERAAAYTFVDLPKRTAIMQTCGQDMVCLDWQLKAVGALQGDVWNLATEDKRSSCVAFADQMVHIQGEHQFWPTLADCIHPDWSREGVTWESSTPAK